MPHLQRVARVHAHVEGNTSIAQTAIDALDGAQLPCSCSMRTAGSFTRVPTRKSAPRSRRAERGPRRTACCNTCPFRAAPGSSARSRLEPCARDLRRAAPAPPIRQAGPRPRGHPDAISLIRPGHRASVCHSPDHGPARPCEAGSGHPRRRIGSHAVEAILAADLLCGLSVGEAAPSEGGAWRRCALISRASSPNRDCATERPRSPSVAPPRDAVPA